ncbi:MAG: hypothetical protein WCU88_11545 [Elusimicrobiota bacterium]|jgi:hypothetical protein
MKVLALIAREPDPQGTGPDREICALLARFGRSADVRCFALGPSSSSCMTEALLARKGVRMLREPAQGLQRLQARVLQACRQERFDGIVVVGAALCGDWLRTLRLAVPSAFLAAFLPDASRIAADLGASGSDAGRKAQSWRGILSTADALWCAHPDDLSLLRRTLGPLRTALSLAPGEGAKRPWRRARARRGLSRLASPAGTAAEMNRLLRRTRKGDVFVRLHACGSEETALSSLREVFGLLPYVGAVVPARASAQALKAGGSREHLAAAWALKHKGAWHEADFPPHACCVLLRREALDAAGLLDERFQDLGAAWRDLFLRMGQAGWPVFMAQDAVVFCGQDASSRLPAADGDLLTEKWCRQSLRFMESLLTSLEPEGYRLPAPPKTTETAGAKRR